MLLGEKYLNLLLLCKEHLNGFICCSTSIFPKVSTVHRRCERSLWGGTSPTTPGLRWTQILRFLHFRKWRGSEKWGWGLNNVGEVLNKEWRKCRSLKDSPTEPCRNHTEAARPQSCLLNLLRGKAAWACQPPALSVTATVPSVTSAEAGRPHAGFWPPC